MKLYFNENGIKVDIYVSSTPLGTPGGQGKVFKVDTSKYSDCCVKIFHTPSHWDLDRIRYMIDNPPHMVQSTQFRFKICWPTHLVFDSASGDALGYMMPLAFTRSETLKLLDSTHLKKTMREEFPNDRDWWKYERSDKKGMINRFMILNNISIAIDSIHSVGHYVIGDIKPENILSTHDGMISIIDTDSFQISDGSKLLFKGAAVTTEYFAPESYTRVQNKLPLTLSNDLFALAICFYKILIGNHPYTGRRQLPPYDKGTDLEYQIRNDLFAFGDRSSFLAIPPIDFHQHFHSLPDRIQDFFKRSFSSVNTHQRPTAAKWIEAFNDVLSNTNAIQSNTNAKITSYTSSSTKQNTGTSRVIKPSFRHQLMVYQKYIYVLLAALIVGGFLYFAKSLYWDNSNTKPNMSVIESFSQKGENITGIYKMRKKLNYGADILTHAELKAKGNNTYSISVYDEIGVSDEFLFFALETDSLSSPILGGGRISYSEKYNEIVLKFIDNNNVIWTFTK